MEQLFVEFTDSGKSDVAGVFGCEQDGREFPYQGVIKSDDPRWLKYFLSLPESVASSFPSPVL